MLRILMVLCLSIAATVASPQALPLTGGGGEEPAPAEAAPLDPDIAGQLVDLLRDDAAREAFLRQLEAAAAETEAAPAEAEPVATTAIDETARTLGRQIAELTQAGSERVVETLERAWTQLVHLPTTLDGLRDAVDPEVVTSALADLAFVLIATMGSFLVLDRVARRICGRLAEAAQGASWLVVVGSVLAFIVVNVIAVALAWAAGYLLTILFYQGFGVIQIRQSLYLNAFLTVGLAKVAGRALLSPQFAALRLIGLPDEAARRLWRWLYSVIVLLGYGLLLAVPIASFSAGYFAGAALEMTIGSIAILYTIYRVVLDRRLVAGWLHPDAVAADLPEQAPLLARFAALWHLPVLAYLAVLLVLVIARPGQVLLPLLRASGEVVGTIVIGLVLIDLLARMARAGVRLPSYVTYRLPLLERRLNRLLPNLLFCLRAIIFLGVIGVCLNIIGLWDLGAWFGSAAGTVFVGRVLTVFVIVSVALLAWLGLASWIEYRLNPLFGRVPTPREITLLTLLRNAATILIMVLTLMITLSQIGLDIAPLLASAGVLGLAIGFGSQKLVQDIITGVFIQFENAMNVGDVVTVGGITGVVEKLTVRSVSLRDLEGAFHIIPFSSVDSVSNFMRDFAYHIADIGVAYREDMEDAKAAMHDAFDRLREDETLAADILGELEWFGLQTFGDSAIVLRARIKTLPGKQWGVGRAYNRLIKEIFDARGIEIPFPHQTIYFGQDRAGNAPPLHVRTDAPDPAERGPRAAE